MKREEMVIVVCRANINIKLIPPLKIILAALSYIAPLSLYSSMGLRIKDDNLYEQLVKHFQQQEGVTCLSDTLRQILNERKDNNFRVCLLGRQEVGWEVILQYRRRGVSIDTGDAQLNQVANITGGISKELTQNNIVKVFLTAFGMSRAVRKNFTYDANQVSFTCKCQCCNNELNNQIWVCSACLCVHCNRNNKECVQCNIKFD